MFNACWQHDLLLDVGIRTQLGLSCWKVSQSCGRAAGSAVMPLSCLAILLAGSSSRWSCRQTICVFDISKTVLSFLLAIISAICKMDNFWSSGTIFCKTGKEEGGLVQQFTNNIIIVKVADRFLFETYVTTQSASLPFLQIFTFIAVPLQINEPDDWHCFTICNLSYNKENCPFHLFSTLP